jgi:hypothetical protein
VRSKQGFEGIVVAVAMLIVVAVGLTLAKWLFR